MTQNKKSSSNAANSDSNHKAPVPTYLEDGDLFRQGAKVRRFSSESLRLQVIGMNIEVDIPVTEQIAAIIATASITDPDKIMLSNAGTKAQYYPCLLAVNSAKHFVMRLEMKEKVNRPYGVSIAFTDDDVIKKILSAIKASGGKPVDATPESSDEPEQAAPTIDGPALAKSVKTEEGINPDSFPNSVAAMDSLIYLVYSIRRTMDCFYTGDIGHLQDCKHVLIGAIWDAQKNIHKNPSAKAAYDRLISLTHQLDGHFTAYAANKLDLTLLTATSAVEFIRPIVKMLADNFTPALIKQLRDNLKTYLWLNMVEASVGAYQVYLNTGSQASLDAANTAMKGAQEIISHIDVTPPYAQGLAYDIDTKTVITEDINNALRGHVKDALDEYHSVAGKLILMLGPDAAKSLTVVACIDLYKMVEDKNTKDFLLQEARIAHNKAVSQSNAISEAFSAKVPADIYKHFGSQGAVTNRISNVHFKIAIESAIAFLFRPLHPNYSTMDILESEEEPLNNLGMLLLYAMHASHSVRLEYCDHIQATAKALLSSALNSEVSLSRNYHHCLMKVILACDDVKNNSSISLHNKGKLHAAINFKYMQINMLEVQSVNADSAFGAAIANMSFLYLQTKIKHKLVAATTIQQMAIQAKSLEEHPLHHVLLMYASNLLKIAAFSKSNGSNMADSEALGDKVSSAFTAIMTLIGTP